MHASVDVKKTESINVYLSREEWDGFVRSVAEASIVGRGCLNPGLRIVSLGNVTFFVSEPSRPFDAKDAK